MTNPVAPTTTGVAGVDGDGAATASLVGPLAVVVTVRDEA
jgi:hypothetical protein